MVTRMKSRSTLMPRERLRGVPKETLLNGLEGYYTFETGPYQDSSGKGRHFSTGTPVSGGLIGNCHTAGVINSGTFSANVSRGMAFSVWFYFSDLPASTYVEQGLTNSSGYQPFRIAGSTGDSSPYITFSILTNILFGSTYTSRSSSTLPANTWHHAFLNFVSGSHKAYVNASLIYTFGSAGFFDPITQVNLAASTISGSTKIRIDEVAWWSRTLTDSEIARLYNNGSGYRFV